MIDKEHFSRWLDDPMTKNVIKYVEFIRKTNRKGLEDTIIEGAPDLSQKTIGLLGGVIGTCNHLLEELEADALNSSLFPVEEVEVDE